MTQGMANSMSEECFKGVGGFNILYRSWRSGGKARSVVVIVHGFNAHSGYYKWVAEQFVASGLAVYALDLRGRGKSDGNFSRESVIDLDRRLLCSQR